MAKLLDLTPQRVQQLANSGVIPKAGHGKYDLIYSVQSYIRHLREMSGTPDESRPRLCTIVELAALFDVNVRTIRNWTTGLPPDVEGRSGRGNAARWSLPRLINHKTPRDTGSGGRLDLEQERARQAKESADKLEFENMVRRGVFAPLSVFDEAFQGYTRQVTSMLDGVTPNLRRLLPHLSEADHQRIYNHLATERERIAARLERGLWSNEPGGEEGSEAMEATAETLAG
jgi:phage terminase Nu1 subunit (DNA packaging protein)